MKIVKLSPKGQITIPKDFRDKIKIFQYVFELDGQNILLRPIKIELLDGKELKNKDECKDFGRLSEKSFSFWDNKQDDIYESFYN